jgi:hypothetical protein
MPRCDPQHESERRDAQPGDGDDTDENGEDPRQTSGEARRLIDLSDLDMRRDRGVTGWLGQRPRT